MWEEKYFKFKRIERKIYELGKIKQILTECLENFGIFCVKFIKIFNH